MKLFWYYMLLVEIKDFNALIDHEPFFDLPVKNKQEAYEKLAEIPRDTDYATGNLLDYLYHHKYYKHWHIFIEANKYEYSSTN